MKWWIFRWGTWSRYRFPPYFSDAKVNDQKIMTYYGIVIGMVFIGVTIGRDKDWVEVKNKIKRLKLPDPMEGNPRYEE